MIFPLISQWESTPSKLYSEVISLRFSKTFRKCYNGFNQRWIRGIVVEKYQKSLTDTFSCVNRNELLTLAESIVQHKRFTFAKEHTKLTACFAAWKQSESNGLGWSWTASFLFSNCSDIPFGQTNLDESQSDSHIEQLDSDWLSSNPHDILSTKCGR